MQNSSPEYQRFMQAMSPFPTRKRKPVPLSDFKCQECGYRLTEDCLDSQLDSDDVECPECGSTDLDIARRFP